MKKHYLLWSLLAAAIALHAQPTTHYGESSGTEGFRGSYFGRGAGAALTMYDVTGYRLSDNTFVGDYAGGATVSNGNTAVGSRSFFSNTSGSGNVAIGWNSLESNTTGNNSTGVGTSTLRNLTTGHSNTAVGTSGLFSLTTGTYNSALGISALAAATTSAYNTAVGTRSLSGTTTGVFNTAVGSIASEENITGTANTAVGWAAGAGSGLSDLFNATAVGYMAKNTTSNQVRIGNAQVTVIGGRVGWSVLSDGRFKKDVKEDVAGLEFINKLRPVSYLVDNTALNKFLGAPDSLDTLVPKGTKQNREEGFIAQEVESLVKKSGYVFHGVSAPQNQNDHYSIRYAEFVVPLVKAVQELTTQLKNQQEEIAALKQQIATSEDKSSSAVRTNAVGGLSQNVPNPFSYDTEIRISLPEDTRTASIMIYALDGKQVKAIPVEEHGGVSVKVGSEDLKPGMYIYSLMVNGAVQDSKRMIILGK